MSQTIEFNSNDFTYIWKVNNIPFDPLNGSDTFASVLPMNRAIDILPLSATHYQVSVYIVELAKTLYSPTYLINRNISEIEISYNDIISGEDIYVNLTTGSGDGSYLGIYVDNQLVSETTFASFTLDELPLNVRVVSSLNPSFPSVFDDSSYDTYIGYIDAEIAEGSLRTTTLNKLLEETFVNGVKGLVQKCILAIKDKTTLGLQILNKPTPYYIPTIQPDLNASIQYSPFDTVPKFDGMMYIDPDTGLSMVLDENLIPRVFIDKNFVDKATIDGETVIIEKYEVLQDYIDAGLAGSVASLQDDIDTVKTLNDSTSVTLYRVFNSTETVAFMGGSFWLKNSQDNGTAIHMIAEDIGGNVIKKIGLTKESVGIRIFDGGQYTQIKVDPLVKVALNSDLRGLGIAKIRIIWLGGGDTDGIGIAKTQFTVINND